MIGRREGIMRGGDVERPAMRAGSVRHCERANASDHTTVAKHCMRATEYQLHLAHALRNGARLDHANGHPCFQKHFSCPVSISIDARLRNRKCGSVRVGQLAVRHIDVSMPT
jgi:hypothetical protein